MTAMNKAVVALITRVEQDSNGEILTIVWTGCYFHASALRCLVLYSPTISPQGMGIGTAAFNAQLE